MGEDEDISVVAFEVDYKEPAQDLMSFIEKGYDWVLDADVSAGEQDDGTYLVFVEIDRTEDLPSNILKLIDDISNLTNQKVEDWTFKYYRSAKTYDMSEESLKSVVILDAKKYKNKFGSTKDESDELSDEEKEALDKMKATAGVKVDTTAPTNEFTESLRIAAGLK